MQLRKPETVETVAILGAGTIGASWAAHFLAHGIGVRVWDPAEGFEANVREVIARAWPSLRRLGAPAQPDEAKISFFADPAETVSACDFVQESGPENKEVKIALYERLDDALPEDVVLASSSSGLLISELQAGRVGAERYVIGHPFNPPHLIPLVEVVGGQASDPAAVDWALAFYNGCGKKAVRINREVPGHLANRLQVAMWREVVHLVETGVASVEDVDIAIAYGPGLRWALMGPNLILHLAGGEGGLRHFLVHLGPSIETWWADLGAPALDQAVRQKLIEGTAAEAKGRSIAELAAERDRLLVALLETLARERGAGG
jgi:3-hydroxyacyl-CoA dehydrogenase